MSIKTAYDRGLAHGYKTARDGLLQNMGLMQSNQPDADDVALGLGGLGSFGAGSLLRQVGTSAQRLDTDMEKIIQGRIKNRETIAPIRTEVDNILKKIPDLQRRHTEAGQALQVFEHPEMQRKWRELPYAESRLGLVDDYANKAREHKKRLGDLIEKTTDKTKGYKKTIADMEASTNKLFEANKGRAEHRAGSLGRWARERGLGKLMKNIGTGGQYLGGAAGLGLLGKKLYDVASD